MGALAGRDAAGEKKKKKAPRLKRESQKRVGAALPASRSRRAGPSLSWGASARRALVSARKLLSGLVTFGLALAVAAVLATGALLFYLPRGERFFIKDIDIKGVSRTSRAEILAVAGLDAPVNFFAFKEDVAANNLKSLPWVEEATVVARPIPDGVSIRVKEYRPKALVNLDQIYYIDDMGRPFKNLEPGENPDLPIVSGFGLDELLSRGPLTMRALAEIYELIDLLSARGDEWRLDNISELRFDPDIGITMFARYADLEIRVGFGPYAEKMARLGKVARTLKYQGLFEGVEYVNLECAPRVTARYARGARPAPEGEIELAPALEAEGETAPGAGEAPAGPRD
jgi:cell division protein FtsQ